MGDVKKFTLRFDMDHPAEFQAFRFLKEESVKRRVSQNTLLMELLIDAMQIPEDRIGEIGYINADELADKITCGVLQGIKEQKIVMRMSEVSNASLGTDVSNVPVEGDFLSDDSMEFLDSFEDDSI